MQKTTWVLSLLLSVFVLNAQTYQPDWKSLDSRPIPQWFNDAKFGIFIHWGVYSVPAYTEKGRYAEWYLHSLKRGDPAVNKYHKAAFGNKSYYDLAPDFKAELFQPDEWAKLFEKSGAKYMVLTSKHHDGYSLWPDKLASASYGVPWNAMESGPKRDLLGELFTAVRKTSVRPGMYYSLYEWFHPLWLKDKKAFAATHTWPQMQELINTYRPDVFWTDGEWDAPDDVWKSKEFLQWLYNESPVKKEIVTYDRWGSGIRFNHGGVYTPEYQPDLDFEDHAWEESRGMGFSYGYNREEDAWDYNSTRSLVLNLVDKVSRGGNFLLDIGPDAHGKIPPIMQERLLQIGDWLQINGEAIYNTVRWKTPAQWSEGRTDYKPKNHSGDLLLKLTVDPDPGYAVKEVFYTYNPTLNNLNAIFAKYPVNRKLVLKNMQLPTSSAIRFLTTKEKLVWQQVGDHVEITLPPYDPNTFTAPYAWAVSIEQFGKYTARPQLKVLYPNGPTKPQLTIQAASGAVIHYTIDGTEPSVTSPVYEAPLVPGKDVSVKAIAVQPGALTSLPAGTTVVKYALMPAVSPKKVQPGLSYKYYEPEGQLTCATIPQNEVKASGTVPVVSLKPKKREEKYAFHFEGYIRIEKDGLYQFFTTSDDGSLLLLDGKEIVNNDGEHGMVEKSGKAWLKKGYHRISIFYFDNGGGNDLKVMMQPDGEVKGELKQSDLFR